MKHGHVFSLGYQGTDLDRYVNTLKSHRVSTVVDVRETPWSYKKGFSKAPLSERLGSEGIRYLHVKSAGNPSRNRKTAASQAECLDRYKTHLAENPLCLVELMEILEETFENDGRICFLCYERSPEDCHRKIILDQLGNLNSGVFACHLDVEACLLEEPVTPFGIPETNDGKRSGVHVKISEKEFRSVLV